MPQFFISMYPFSVAHYFRRYLNFFQIRINKMVNSINTLALQDQSQGYILSYFFKVLRVLPLSRMLVEFSLRLVYSTMCGKLSRKNTESANSYSCSPPPPLHPTPYHFPVKARPQVNQKNMKMTWNIRLSIFFMI